MLSDAKDRVEPKLGVVHVDSSDGSNDHNAVFSGWKLTATSIHGNDDKITLTPSVLEYLTSSENDGLGDGERPLASRVGVFGRRVRRISGQQEDEGSRRFDSVCRRQATALEDSSAVSDIAAGTAGSVNSSDDALMTPPQQLGTVRHQRKTAITKNHQHWHRETPTWTNCRTETRQTHDYLIC